ncbi:hypothetical protein F5X99DRAFT_363088 [Biscogniauxia marginata]|nr:hypothetical protein F5X99DRAFT_363088 [Biscogniauxia marginata]
MVTNVVLAAALVGAASAHLPAVAKRDFFLQGRQELDETCQSAINDIMPLYADLPMPPDDLLSITMPADPCATPTLTGSLSSELSSYTSEVLDWYSSNGAALESALASCTSLSAYASEVPVCSTAASTGAGTTAAGSSSRATSTSGSTASSGSASQTATPNAAPRETGFVVAAAAGFLGAVAVL